VCIFITGCLYEFQSVCDMLLQFDTLFPAPEMYMSVYICCKILVTLCNKDFDFLAVIYFSRI